MNSKTAIEILTKRLGYANEEGLCYSRIDKQHLDAIKQHIAELEEFIRLVVDSQHKGLILTISPEIKKARELLE